MLCSSVEWLIAKVVLRLVPEVSVPEVSVPEVTLKKKGAAVAYNQIMSSLVDNRMDMNDVAPFDDEILIAANRLELGEHGSCHHSWCHGSRAASPNRDLASIEIEGAPSNGHRKETESFSLLRLAMGSICSSNSYKCGVCCNSPPGSNRKHPASDSGEQCFVSGIRVNEAFFSFSLAVEPPRNRALDYVWKERKGEKLGACTEIVARSNSVLHSRCLGAATFKHDNILAHHTNRHVVVSIVRTTPIVAASSAASSSSTLSRTKFGTIVVAETTSWMEAFQSVQQEFYLLLILPIVVICFGAAIIATSLASMRCCAVEKKKKKKKKGTYFFFFWHIFFAPTYLIAIFYFFDIV